MSILLGKPPIDFVISNNPKDFERWIFDFENYLSLVSITIKLDDNQKRAMLINIVGNDVRTIIEGLVIGDTYDSLLSALRSYFAPKSNLTFQRYEFSRMQQADNEPVMSFINRLQQKVKDCDFESTDIDTILNQRIRDQLIIGVKADDVRKRLLSEESKLDKCVRLCQSFEASAVVVDKLKCDLKITSEVSKSFADPHLFFAGSNSRDRRYSSSNSSISLRNNNQIPKIVCYYCKKPNHTKPNCFKFKRDSEETSYQKTKMVCDYCKKPNHTKPNCFKYERDSEEKRQFHSSKSDSTYLNLHMLDLKDKAKTRSVTALLFGKPLRGIVDTGASISIVNERFLETHDLLKHVFKTEHRVTIANSDHFTLSSAISGPFEMQSLKIKSFFYVSKNIPVDCIFGMNLLEKFGSIIFSSADDDSPTLLLSILPNNLKAYADIFDKQLDEAVLDLEPESIINVSFADTKPHQARVRKFSAVDEKVMRDQIPTLLKQGVIKKSKSSWRHMPVIVPKRNGGHRMAIDYKPINSVTALDAYPLPLMEDMFEKLADAKLFSSLDFSQFYLQIPLHSDDQKFTAFYACGELYEFKRLPFGLKNAVSCCARIMKNLFGHLQGVVIYVDDLLVFGTTQEEHDSRLKAVLDIIRRHNLSLRLSKCQFNQTVASFLGHNIEDGKIKPCPERINPILHFRVPTEIPELERFLGMTNFFRKFINNYARLAKPLYVMTREKQLNWSKDSLENFQTIKTILGQSILALPSATDKLVLYTDASADCIGSCLMNDQKQPIAFASKKLTDVESRWSVIEKEAYAIVWSVEKFRSFLIGRPFLIQCDHKPLKYLFESVKVPEKIHRWRVRLGQFNFKVNYIEGNRNVVADTLSRIYSIASVDADCNFSIDRCDVLDAQKRDHDCQQIYTFLSLKRRDLQGRDDTRPHHLKKNLSD